MKKNVGIAAGLYALCLIIRLVFLGDPGKGFSGDEGEYYMLSEGLLRGKGFALDGESTAWRTPGYPVFLAGLRAVAGDEPATLRLAGIFVVSLIAPLIYFLCLSLFKEDPLRARRTGLIAGLVWVGMKSSISMAGVIGGEEMATLLFVIYLLLACKALERFSLKWLLAATVVLTAAIFIRGYLLFVLFVLPLIFIVKRHWKPALAGLLLSFLLLGSWAYRNYRVIGQFTFSTESVEVIWLGNCQFARGGSPGLFNSRGCMPDSAIYDYMTTTYPGFCQKPEYEKAKIFEQEIKDNLDRFIRNGIRLIPKKTLIFFSPFSWMGFDPVYFVALILGAVALVRMIWTRILNTRVIAIIGLPVLFCLLISLLTYSDVRHRHPVNVQIAVLGSMGICFLVDRFKPGSPARSGKQPVN